MQFFVTFCPAHSYSQQKEVRPVTEAEQLFEKVSRPNGTSLYRICLIQKKTREDAEVIMQEVI